MDEISHTELIQGMRMGYFPAGSVIIDAIEALQREKAEQAKRIAELEAQPAQSVPDGWKLVPDYKVGMPVKYNGKEAKIFAIGDRKGTFDLRLQSGCGLLNVPPDAIEFAAAPSLGKSSLDAQKPVADATKDVPSRCAGCGGTGYIFSTSGEWICYCDCEVGQTMKSAPTKE